MITSQRELILFCKTGNDCCSEVIFFGLKNLFINKKENIHTKGSKKIIRKGAAIPPKLYLLAKEPITTKKL